MRNRKLQTKMKMISERYKKFYKLKTIIAKEGDLNNAFEFNKMNKLKNHS